MAIQKPGAAQQAPAAASLNPDDFLEGGGLYDDFDGEILDIAFTTFDYNGETDPTLSLALEILNEDADPEDSKANNEGKVKNPFVQNYSGGDLKHFVPSDDGQQAVPVGTRTALSKSCGAYRIITSMIMAGFDKSLVGNKVGVFKGARFHFKRESEESVKKENEGKDFKRKPNLLAEKLLSMPGEAKAKTVRPNPKALVQGQGQGQGGPSKPTTPVKPSSPANRTPTVPPAQTTTTSPSNGSATLPSEDVQAYAALYIIEKLAEAGGAHPKAGLAKDVIKWAAVQGLDIPTRNKVIQALGNEGFLGMEGLGWSFDGATLTQA